MAETGIDASLAKAIVEAILADRVSGGVPCVLVGEPTDYEFWWVQVATAAIIRMEVASTPPGSDGPAAGYGSPLSSPESVSVTLSARVN